MMHFWQKMYSLIPSEAFTDQEQETLKGLLPASVISVDAEKLQNIAEREE